MHFFISLQEVQKSSAGIVSFIHDLIHKLNNVSLHIFPVDTFKVVVVLISDQLLLINFVEDQPVVSGQNRLDGSFISPHNVFGRHAESAFQNAYTV